MKYIKIYEEFEVDPTKGYHPIPFTDNEIKLLTIKSAIIEIIKYIDSIFMDLNYVSKISNDYYIVNNNTKCVSIHDVIKYCNIKMEMINNWMDNFINTAKVGCFGGKVLWVNKDNDKINIQYFYERGHVYSTTEFIGYMREHNDIHADDMQIRKYVINRVKNKYYNEALKDI